ncbi:MAG: FAD-dependent oxidoreductase [Candidatus Helarchaeota archaeon]
MSPANLKLALILCTCGGTLEAKLNYEKIRKYFKNDQRIVQIYTFDDFCFQERLEEVITFFQKKEFDWVIIAACTPQIIEMQIKNNLKRQNLLANFEIVNLREQCAWVHSNREKATEKSIALIRGAVAKVENAHEISKKSFKIKRHVTIIGGGISGLSIAANLSQLGFNVLIIEKKSWVGGHLIYLSNVTPYNKPGKEIIKPYLEAFNEDLVKIKRNTEVNWIEGGFGNYKIHITTRPSYIAKTCNNCRKCIEECPILVDDPLNKGLAKVKVIDDIIGAPFSESLIIQRENCPSLCNRCEVICPQNAIDLSKEVKEEIITTSFIVFSAGYELYRPSQKSQYKLGRHSDILTQLELARMLDLEGPTKGKIIRLSSGKEATRILMVQCVGSRDIRTAEYCSKYCCTTAIRHAIEIKERNPGCEICICYIDIRTPFWDEEDYRRARELGIEFIRGKIGNIYYSPETLTTEVVDTILARQINYQSDLLVLSTAMLPSAIPAEIIEMTGLSLEENGFLKAYYSKLKLTTTNKIGIYIGGAVSGPKMVSECLADANTIALSIMKEYPKLSLIKEDAVSIVDENLCNGCELCVRICPQKIPILIQKEEKMIAYIDEVQCKGCGICTSLCPTNAVQLESFQRDQLFAQIEGVLADAPHKTDPIIIGFVCEECAYATIDFAGMVKSTYSEAVRFIRLPCVGRLSILDILTTFKHGADIILIFGCEEGKCHYLEGNTRTRLIVEVVKELLEEIGWQSERIKMYGLFSADVHKFINAVQDALELFEKLGHAPSRLKLLSKRGEEVEEVD